MLPDDPRTAGDKTNIDPDIDLADDEVEEESSLPSLEEDVPQGPLAAGVAAIQRYAKLAPKGPGVYRMADAKGEVLYVGKAKSIRKRIVSYARQAGHTARIVRMIAATASMEFVTTTTETEALLLETNLIKRLRPRFNVLMRDDKSFPYIVITAGETPPMIAKHRGARNKPGDYYGPFASAQAVHRTITALERAFLIRSCSDPVYQSRTRPCLLHQIKRCSAPCTGEISHRDYAELVREAKAFLSGKSRVVKDELAGEMEKASGALDFERAAVYRDRLAALSAIQARQGVNPRGVEEADVFAVHQQAGYSCVEVFFFRTGQNWGNRAYFPRADRSLEPGEVLGAFLAQFYDDKPPPRCVFVSHEIEDRALLAEALTLKSSRKVEISLPQRGEKKELVDHAAANAREALGRKLAETQSQQNLLNGLAETFGLRKAPRRIEVYDNSHIQGSNAVGAMIVAGPEGFRKNQYRKFNIRSEALTPGDDFGMMREVLTRRFKRLMAEAPREPESSAAAAAQQAERVPPEQAASQESAGARFPQLERGNAFEESMPLAAAAVFVAPEMNDVDAEEPDSPWPDLLLVDGGLGQLNAAQEVLAAMGITSVPLIGIAKGPDRDAGRETFFISGREPIKLKPRDPVLYFVQRLRDEAHRFAVGSHRQKRKKDIREAGLQEIPGIGPTRKRALLRHFGTLKAIERASVADLEHVPGINVETARKIYDFFHETAPRTRS
ncbi:MAG: excinuclease ABC subunit UvrC [Alphaproteobacteria bacterium]